MILAFDTATPATTVALCPEGDDAALEARDDPAPGARPAHASRLLALVAEVLDRGEVGWSDVDRIAVGVGPGTFTGLRIGIATARGLAQARELPLTGVSTLQSLAVAVDASRGSVLAVLDARRGEAFAAAWPAGRALDPAAALLSPRAVPPEALGELAGGLRSPVLAVGDGAIKFTEVLERSGCVVPADGSELHRVRAIHHCRIARGIPAGAPDRVRPEYLRLPDAEISRRRRTS